MQGAFAATFDFQTARQVTPDPGSAGATGAALILTSAAQVLQ
jgi:hypothetical protein